MADKYSNIPVPTPTNKPVPSTDIRDHVFGGAKIDEFVTSLQKTYTDRFGQPHFTIEGLRWVAQQAIASFGYILVDSFQAGATLSLPNQVLRNTANGEYYRWDGPLPKTVPAGSTPQTTGGIGAGAWLGVGSAVLSSSQDGAGDELVAVKQPFPGAVASTVHEKMKQLRSAQDFGSNGGDASNKTAELNNAFASFGHDGNGELYLEPGIHIANDYLNNPFGIETTGPGYIAIPKANGVRRITSYADKHKYTFGKEYLYAAYNRMKRGQGVMDGRLNVYLYGDSTLHGGNGEAFNLKPENWISALFRYAGAPNVNITNRAIPGTKVESLDTGTDLGPNTKLIIIKYGVNDAAYPKDVRHQIFMEQLNLKLAEIRTKPYGDISNLSIILMGPNTTNDSPNGRDEEWYETIRGIYAAAARKFQCAYFDTYGLFRDPNGAAGLWLDAPPSLGSGIGIHPVDEGNMWIYGEMFDEFFSVNKVAYFSANSRWNLPGIVEGISYTASPLGLYRASETWHTVSTLSGWPVSGLCRGYLSIDGVTTQSVYDNLSSRVLHRSAKPGNTQWNPFTGVAADLNLGNGWIAASSNYNTPSVILTSDGTAVLRGAIRAGTVDAGTAMFTIPAGFRPLRTSRHVVPTGVGVATAIIELTPNGQGTIVGGADNALMFLEGITYSV